MYSRATRLVATLKKARKNKRRKKKRRREGREQPQHPNNRTRKRAFSRAEPSRRAVRLEGEVAKAREITANKENHLKQKEKLIRELKAKHEAQCAELEKLRSKAGTLSRAKQRSAKKLSDANDTIARQRADLQALRSSDSETQKRATQRASRKKGRRLAEARETLMVLKSSITKRTRNLGAKQELEAAKQDLETDLAEAKTKCKAAMEREAENYQYSVDLEDKMLADAEIFEEELNQADNQVGSSSGGSKAGTAAQGKALQATAAMAEETNNRATPTRTKVIGVRARNMHATSTVVTGFLVNSLFYFAGQQLSGGNRVPLYGAAGPWSLQRHSPSSF